MRIVKKFEELQKYHKFKKGTTLLAWALENWEKEDNLTTEELE